MINVQIHSFKDDEAAAEQDEQRERYQMQAYASPIRYPLSGTTGTAESGSKT